ncbi:MAG TPA: hypothetical protein VGO80_16380, partial [Solirubrobacteraceae bacterium]|nr:hypothetical protein [Solirubrobacteraceae bacterium]
CLALAHEQLGNLKHLEAELDEAAAELAHQSSGAAADKPPVTRLTTSSGPTAGKAASVRLPGA